MKIIKMNRPDYDTVADINLTFLPCEIDILLRGIECYAFIYHSIYSTETPDHEEYLRDYFLQYTYSKLLQCKNPNTKTYYDVEKNCRQARIIKHFSPNYHYNLKKVK